MFLQCHTSAILNLKADKDNSLLWFLMVIHYRKIVYSASLAFLSSYPAIQIIGTISLSVLMMACVIHFKPFKMGMMNMQEFLDEVIIVLCCYHFILFSSFVPISAFEFRHYVGISFVITLGITCFSFIISIFYPIFLQLSLLMRFKYHQRRFGKSRQEIIERRA
jgi:hypothetical protein